MNPLLQGLMDAGLIQFGQFVRDGASVPVQFHLEMLGSYPEVLRIAADKIVNAGENVHADRWLCAADAIPLGTAISLQTGIPLVYHTISAGDRVELVGAYDIGHPTALIVNVLDRKNLPSRLIAHARRVGLHIQHVVGLVDLNNGELPADFDVTLHSLYQMQSLTAGLARAGVIPEGQARRVLEWLGNGN